MDKSSSSFELPIIINVPGGINQLVTYKGILYIQAGNVGDWFYTLGQIAYKCAEIPESIRENASFKCFANAACVIEDVIYFGLSTSGGSGGLCGIWSFDTRLTGAKNKDSSSYIQQARMEHLISSLEDGTNDVVEIDGMIPASTKGFFYGWEDSENSAYGIDVVNAGYDAADRYLYSGSNAYMISQWYNIGDKKSKRTVQKTEIQLAKALGTNESIKIYYRTERDGTWVLYHTMSTGQSDNGNIIPGLERIQWKIVLDTGVNDKTGPELLYFSFTLN